MNLNRLKYLVHRWLIKDKEMVDRMWSVKCPEMFVKVKKKKKAKKVESEGSVSDDELNNEKKVEVVGVTDEEIKVVE